jgi:hypothetical protein
MSASRRGFTTEYKVEAEQRAIDPGRSISEVAREPNVGVAPRPLGQAGIGALPSAPDRVLIKRAMIEAAHKRVLYIDHSKFERRALHDAWVEVMLAPVTPARRERCDGLAASALGQISPRN